MDYLDLMTRVYRVVRHQSQWTKKDTQRVEKMAKLLQIEIEAELLKAGFIPDNGAIVPIVHQNTRMVANEIIEPKEMSMPKFEPNELGLSNPTEEQQIVEPLSLMQRIFSEQDNAELPPTELPKVKKPLAATENIIKSVGGVRRYFVSIICNGIKNKPSFQIFKGNDIVETNFRTDEIVKQQNTYYAVVDSDNTAKIRQAVDNCFLNAFVSGFEEHDLTWIPPQYQQIFQHRTKIIE